jgi:hypothetical protein
MIMLMKENNIHRMTALEQAKRKIDFLLLKYSGVTFLGADLYFL